MVAGSLTVYFSTDSISGTCAEFRFHCGDKAVRFTELLVFLDFDVQLDLHAPVV